MYIIHANADIDLQDNIHATALMRATRSRKWDIMELLLEMGADINDELINRINTSIADAETHGALSALQTRIKALMVLL